MFIERLISTLSEKYDVAVSEQESYELQFSILKQRCDAARLHAAMLDRQLNELTAKFTAHVEREFKNEPDA